jgi:cyanophycinase
MAERLSSDHVTLAGWWPQAVRCSMSVVVIAGLAYVCQLGVTLGFLSLEKADYVPSATSRMPGGALVICGGGTLPENIRGRFLELAGGPAAKIVVIPTANSFADGPMGMRTLELWKPYRLASLQLLHTRSREQANDPAFVRPLQEATGVWMSGGTQQRLIEAYRGTEVERQLKTLLERGGVIGGTSAGAAVMSGLMIEDGRTEAKLGEGFDFFPGTVIDQHFLRRRRIQRLLGVVKLHPELVGLGIDESTAVVVNVRMKKIQVIGSSYVIACVPEVSSTTPSAPDAAGPDAGPGASDEASKVVTVRFEILKHGDEADLSALKTLSVNAVIPGIDFEAM